MFDEMAVLLGVHLFRKRGGANKITEHNGEMTKVRVRQGITYKFTLARVARYKPGSGILGSESGSWQADWTRLATPLAMTSLEQDRDVLPVVPSAVLP